MEPVEELSAALQEGDVDSVREILAASGHSKELVNVVCWGYSMLCCAIIAEQNNLELVNLLLDAGANPLWFEPTKPSVAEKLREQEIALVESLGIPVDGYQPWASRGIPPAISLTLRSGRVEIVKAFERHGVDLVTCTAAMGGAVAVALYNEHDPTDVVKYLIERDMHLNSEGQWPGLHFHWRTFLEFPSVLSVLVEAGFDIGTLGWNELFIAMIHDSVPGISAALENGESIDHKDVHGHSALFLALLGGKCEAAHALMDAGAKVSEGGNDYSSPLTAALHGGRFTVVERLIRLGFDLNARDGDGFAPITLAAYTDDIEIVRLMLKNGADPEPVIWEAQDEFTDFSPEIKALLIEHHRTR